MPVFSKFLFCVSMLSSTTCAFSNEMQLDNVTLDHYLQHLGYYMTPEGSGERDNFAIEGFSTEAQRRRLVELLNGYPKITSILEIGLNGGHSAENFIKACPHLQKIVSMDINWHSYTAPAAQYLSCKYPEQFVFVIGDSREKIPELARQSPEQKFDLIFIDGNHAYEYCLMDIINSRLVAHAHSILLVDDYNFPSVQQAVRECQGRGIIEVLRAHEAHDPHGLRSWIECRFR